MKRSWNPARSASSYWSSRRAGHPEGQEPHMTRLIATAAFITFAIAAAGGQAPAQQHQGHDTSKPAQGGGSLPAGWQLRTDSGAAQAAGVRFSMMGTGFHVM